MCFSVQVDKDLKKLAKRFNATPSVQAFTNFNAIQKLENERGAEYLKAELGLKRKPRSKVFKDADEEGRVFPGYWTNVIVIENNKRVIKPMRYRVRPAHSIEEIPSKYNVFNSRVDALEKRQTWQSIFMKNHGLFPFLKFYEWVERKGKKTLVNFTPDEVDIMWAPAIFDTWKSNDGHITFDSFALLTDDPPKEVEEAGHDRCPIFIKEESIDNWLDPKDLNKKDIYQILGKQETVYFSHQIA